MNAGLNAPKNAAHEAMVETEMVQRGARTSCSVFCKSHFRELTRSKIAVSMRSFMACVGAIGHYDERQPYFQL